MHPNGGDRHQRGNKHQKEEERPHEFQLPPRPIPPCGDKIAHTFSMGRARTLVKPLGFDFTICRILS